MGPGAGVGRTGGRGGLKKDCEKSVNLKGASKNLFVVFLVKRRNLNNIISIYCAINFNGNG